MKFLKWFLIIAGSLMVLGFFGSKNMRQQTKKHSPEAVVSYSGSGVNLSVFYNRPSKKGREIFGDLVPYNEVWRTGANEATTFSTDKEIGFGDKLIPAGTYTLWTIPQKTQWTVILNTEMYDWGVGFGGASRDPDYDIVKINVPVKDLEEEVEQFTIEFIYHTNLVMKWDKTEVMVPISLK